jgi:hypothetical protein
MEAIGAIQGKRATKYPVRRSAEADKPNEGPARKRLNSRPTCRSCHRSRKTWDFGPTDLAGRANKPLMIVAIARRCFGPMSSLVSLVSCASCGTAAFPPRQRSLAQRSSRNRTGCDRATALGGALPRKPISKICYSFENGRDPSENGGDGTSRGRRKLSDRGSALAGTGTRVLHGIGVNAPCPLPGCIARHNTGIHTQ